MLRKVCLNVLMGVTDDDPFDVFGGFICNENELLTNAQLKKQVHVVTRVYESKFFSAFWMGDFDEAMAAFTKLSSTPASKQPRIQIIFNAFYGGIVMYTLFREGKGQHLLEEGNKVLDKMKLWHKSW